MDRQIIYPGAIPLETDLLNTNKYTMIALSKLAATVMGTNTYLRGLTAAPTSPASMVVTIDRGEIYSVQNVDNTAYSSLAADTVNTILKQGIILSQTSFTLTAPTTAGQSINYLVQVTYSDVDSGATVLPYYNAANPSVAYSGPNGSGTAQNTVRSGVCTVALKAGVAATTGTQTTPSVDTGYTAAWVITVPQGATTITAANISLAANAPFLPVSGIVDAIQKCTMTYAADTGSANTYVASFVPKLPTLVDGMRLTFKAKTANTGASTFAPNGNTAYPLYSHANQALQGGEIIANGLIEVEWNSTLTAWVLCGNSGGALPVASPTQSNHAVPLSLLNSSLAAQSVGRLLNIQTFTSSGTYTPTLGTTKIRCKQVGGGGAGGGTLSTSGSQIASGGGGNGGTYGDTGLMAVPSSSVSIIVGTAGAGVAGGNGGSGGSTSFGAYLVSPGGAGGPVGAAGGAGTLASDNISSLVSTGTNVSISLPGDKGTGAFNISVASNGIKSGGGGDSQFGIGGGGINGTTSPNIGRGYGSGGGGNAAGPGAASSIAGANGASGICIIEEYA